MSTMRRCAAEGSRYCRHSPFQSSGTFARSSHSLAARRADSDAPLIEPPWPRSIGPRRSFPNTSSNVRRRSAVGAGRERERVRPCRAERGPGLLAHRAGGRLSVHSRAWSMSWKSCLAICAAARAAASGGGRRSVVSLSRARVRCTPSLQPHAPWLQRRARAGYSRLPAWRRCGLLHGARRFPRRGA